MKRSLALVLILVLAAAAALAQAKKEKLYRVTGFVGKSSSEAAPGVSVILVHADTGEIIGSDQTNFFGKYTIKDVPPGIYQLRVEKIQRTLGVKDKNVRLDIDLSAEAGLMDYAKTGIEMINKEKEAKAAAKAGEGGQGGTPAGASAGGGPTDASLMSYFAGEYYSYSSGSTMYGGAGTERKMTLCPDGLYRDSSEFSASGTGQWGSASAQGSGAARWTIQGDKNQGTITVTYANGRTKQFIYRVVSKQDQTISFDGVTFAYAGEPKCR